MDIESKLIDIKCKFPLSNESIEQELKQMGIIPLRWAIVQAKEDILTISLACETK